MAFVGIPSPSQIGFGLALFTRQTGFKLAMVQNMYSRAPFSVARL
jgi:hypothetical protein